MKNCNDPRTFDMTGTFTSPEESQGVTAIDAGAAVNPNLDSVERSSSNCSRSSSRSRSGGGSGDHNKKTKNNAKHDGSDFLSQHETERLLYLRLLVLLVLLAAALAVSITVYWITNEADKKSFETHFEGISQQMNDAFSNIIQNKLGAMSSLAVAMTAHGMDTTWSAWPFLTLSNFQQRSATARSLSDALFVGVAHYVNDSQRTEWDTNFVNGPDAYWIEEGFKYQRKLGLDIFEAEHANETEEDALHPIFTVADISGEPVDDEGPGPYLPVWQTSPVLHRHFVNQNIWKNEGLAANARLAWDNKALVLGGLQMAPAGGLDDPHAQTAFYATIMSIAAGKAVDYLGDPITTAFLPIFNNFDDNDKRYPVAIMFAEFRWADYFANILPPSAKGIRLVLENHCHGSYTYELNGEAVIPVGPGDLHDEHYSHFGREIEYHDLRTIADGTESGLPIYVDHEHDCDYHIDIYPSHHFYNEFQSKTKIYATTVVAVIFFFAILMFILYDRIVERRQRLIVRKALQTSAIVSSLFPKQFRDRLLQTNQDNNIKKKRKGRGGGDGGGNDAMANAMALPHSNNARLMSYLSGSARDDDLGLQPIADLFPHATVMIADIAGFTAWSSTRDPAQVFILLQNVYHAFDTIAQKLVVFKVETIGDSYVAVTGCPEAQEDHALIMAKFASACLAEMCQMVKDLEVTLGPDTGDLTLRIGLHSGPVTAGVLRGERSRFQLFGDTVNTAARMENTGIASRIQVSQATADLLVASGKQHWLTPREDAVEAQGKGVLKSFWLSHVSRRQQEQPVHEQDGHDTTSSSDGISTPSQPISVITAAATGEGDSTALNVKRQRLVDWIVELLSEHVKHIVAKRRASEGTTVNNLMSSLSDVVYRPEAGRTALDEVVEVIALPHFDAKAAREAQDYQDLQLDAVVLSQLKQYVSMIAASYRDNPFHNFEHACHVTMSVNKFLKRIVAPDLDDLSQWQGKSRTAQPDTSGGGGGSVALHLHDYTHGLTSDPLAHFAIVFSALIHDVDHRGVSNAQLIKEDDHLATLYRNKSVAEQHSLDLSWKLLMTEPFCELRKCIFQSNAELRRFRQLVVNVVLATDIFDKELNDQRKARWNKAFSDSGNSPYNKDLNDNLRATIVIEHIIQASDVSHTMQHWHIYQKWNKLLFAELHRAYNAGRMGADPASFWYKGELGFFDNYIIPLAKKLKDCNVFGVASDECLNYALKNRAEWEDRGKEIVEKMVVDANGDV